ncbi:MAG: DUF5655 domain-containing protein [Bacteroidota bacterium]
MQNKMIQNLEANTGKSLAQWIDIVRAESLEKHGQMIKFLKEKHGFTHGFANLVAHKARQSDAGSASDTDQLIDQQYKGKEHFRPLYDALLSQIAQFGEDVEVAPKKAYVSLRRKKQFAILKPATKSRFEIGLNLKGETASGRLEEITSKNAMCSHQIKLSADDSPDEEIIQWLKMAYDKS